MAKPRQKYRPKERGSIPGDFAWRLIEMLESPPYRVLSLSAHRALSRIEIELGHHGGKENGELPCTFDHFVEFGIHRHAIAPAIRELVALGFVEITRQGCAGNAGFRQPTLFRLTYRHFGSHQGITDEWRRIKTIEEAEAIAGKVRLSQSRRVPKNKSPVPENALFPVPEETITGASAGKRTERGQSPVPETITTSISRVPPPKLIQLDDPRLDLGCPAPAGPSLNNNSAAHMLSACAPTAAQILKRRLQ